MQKAPPSHSERPRDTGRARDPWFQFMERKGELRVADVYSLQMGQRLDDRGAAGSNIAMEKKKSLRCKATCNNILATQAPGERDFPVAAERGDHLR